MRWKLINEFDRLLDEYGNTGLDEARKKLIAWDLRRQVKLKFHGKEEEEETETDYIWVDSKDLADLIEYLTSGQRQSYGYETNEEVRYLIEELREILGWIDANERDM